MKLTSKGRYAVMALVDLARFNNINPVSLRDISLRQGILLDYLEQIFSKLRKKEIVQSVRGNQGGYVLNKKAKEIKLMNIFDAVDEKVKTVQCKKESKKSCNGRSTKCLTHNLWDELENHINDFFEKKIEKFKELKYQKKIILDPGIGFGKNLKHNLMILNKISLFHTLGFPILIGTSRKRFINQISGKYDTKERVGGTLASIIFSFSQGIKIFRVHNVEEVKQGLLVFETLLNK